VTRGAIPVLLILVMRRSDRFQRPNAVIDAVAGQAELINRAVLKQPRIRRSVRRVTGLTAFGLDWCMLVYERTLLVGVALDTRGIRARRQPGLLQLETAMRIVAIAAAHRTFQHFVMERHVERWLHFAMAAEAELWVV